MDWGWATWAVAGGAVVLALVLMIRRDGQGA
jgi:hypothetical protein